MTRFFAPSSEFYNAADTGGGGGGAAAAGASSAGGGGSQGATGSQAAGGGGGGTPITLTPDSMVTLPGSTTPVKWGDHSANYVAKADVEKQQAAFVQQFVQNLAKASGGKKQPQGQQQRQPQQRQAPPDWFEGVRGQPLITGDAIVALGERMQREGIAPLYEWAGQVNNLLEQVGKKLQLTEKATGSLIENRSRGEFDGKMKNAVAMLAKDVLEGINPEEHPVLADFAQDVYLSYDPNDPTLEKEFPGLLKSRMDGLLKLANAIAQAKLSKAREQRRHFLRPGGHGQPGGNARPERLSHRQIAQNMFAADASAT